MASEGPAKTESASASPAAAAPTGTVTFLFTDIEGSTRLLERLRGRYAEVLADQRRLLREAFAAWHGHEIDTQGDSFFVAFPRASEALRCAIAAQHSLAAWHWPPGVEVRVRMGIHTGEPLVASGGYVGMDVHRAARIAAAGHGGQVLLSGTARDLVADDLPESIELRDLGNHRLKDMRTETRLYQVGGEGLRADFEPLVTGAADEPAPTPGDPPYRGLQAFEEEDAALFFGREEIVGELVEQLRGARLLAIIGASGSGKSSILRAGAIPALREGQAAWRILLLTPTAHPIEALAGAIEPDASPARLAALADDLRADPRSLAVALRPTTGRASAGRGRTVIAIDQLEEVFTLCRDEIERKAFLAALVHASGLDDGPADTPPERRAVMLAAALVVAAVLAGVAFILARESDANATLAQQRAEEAGSNASIAEERAREARENADLAAQSAQEARDAEALAEEQATRAFAERLGADATQILASGREPELAALLSLNALRAGYTPQADAALQRASRAGFGQVFMHDGPVDSLGVTPDDKTMITVADGTVHVWDVDSGSTTQTFPAPLRSGLYSYLELSADGRVLLVSGYDGPGALYRVSGAGPALVEPIRVDCPSLDASDGIRALSGDGKVLATYLTGGAAGGGSGDVVAVTIPDCDPVGEPFRLAGQRPDVELRRHAFRGLDPRQRGHDGMGRHQRPGNINIWR